MVCQNIYIVRFNSVLFISLFLFFCVVQCKIWSKGLGGWSGIICPSLRLTSFESHPNWKQRKFFFLFLFACLLIKLLQYLMMKSSVLLPTGRKLQTYWNSFPNKNHNLTNSSHHIQFFPYSVFISSYFRRIIYNRCGPGSSRYSD